MLDSPFDPWTDGSSSLRRRIDRHVFRDPGDWSAGDLFAVDEEMGCRVAAQVGGSALPGNE